MSEFKDSAYEDYMTTPISVLRYISELENSNEQMLEILKEIVDKIENCDDSWWMSSPDKGGFDLDKIKQLIQQSTTI